MEPSQPPPPPVVPAPPQVSPDAERYRLTTFDKVIFAFFFSIEILFFIWLASCAFLLAGIGAVDGGSMGLPLLLVIPVIILMFGLHFVAFKTYHELQDQPTKGLRLRMYLFLFLPLLGPLFAVVVLSNMRIF
jgi:hypothetical protein